MVRCREQHPCFSARSCRGFITIEALASLAVVAVLLAFVGQWSSAIMQHRRAIERRRTAIQATDNVVALAMATEFANVTAENLLTLAQPYTPKRAKWEIRVEKTPIADVPDVHEKKRIVVGLTFQNNSRYNVRPLVVWKYPTQTRGTRDD